MQGRIDSDPRLVECVSVCHCSILFVSLLFFRYHSLAVTVPLQGIVERALLASDQRLFSKFSVARAAAAKAKKAAGASYSAAQRHLSALSLEYVAQAHPYDSVLSYFLRLIVSIQDAVVCGKPVASS